MSTCALASNAQAQAFSYGLADGNGDWPSSTRDVIVQAMDEATAIYNRYGHFDKRVTANFNAGVPTAQANYDGWIDFGNSRNTRVALHEIAHTLGVGTYWGFDGGAWAEDSAAGRLIKLYEGQAAVVSTGGTHFWPYGLNYDDEDGAAARERHCKLVAALRFDMGIVEDSDADGLPDDWETFHFGSLAEDGAGDADADGITNAFEHATDSDPNVAVPVADGHAYALRGQISGRLLSVAAASSDEGAPTEQRDGEAEPHAQWLAEYVGEGYFRFTNVSSGKVLEVPGTDTASALPIQQGTWSGARSQQWRIATGPGAELGYFFIANRETARVVDGLDGAEGAPVQQYPFIGDIPQQFWAFEDLTEGEAPSDAGTSDAGAAGDGGVPDAGSGISVDAAPLGVPPSAQMPSAPRSAGCAISTPSASRRSSLWLVPVLALLVRRTRLMRRVPIRRRSQG